MATIGKRNTLKIVRASQPGLYLDGEDLGEILLPGRFIPKDLAPKQLLDVFIYRDSEDRLVATTETPLVEVGEFAALKVLSVNQNVGAFLDWGLSKDLLLPFREQDRPLRVGDRVVVYVYLDLQSERIVASARLGRHLRKEAPAYRVGQPVNLFISSKTELGYNAIIENSYRGLLYYDRVHVPLEIGQKVLGYIAGIRPEGKIDLSLDTGGRKRIPPLTTKIMDALKERGGKLPYDDSTAPEEIRTQFQASKKAFKQALGGLYKRRCIRFTNPGIEMVATTNFSPGRS